MTANRVTVAIEKYGKQIPSESIGVFKNYLKEASDDCMDEFMSIKIKSKTTTLLFSIFFGGIGVDRFYIGDNAKGAGKLILNLVAAILSEIAILGPVLSLASSIWCIVDIFRTYKEAKQINFENLVSFLRKHKEEVVETPIE